MIPQLLLYKLQHVSLLTAPHVGLAGRLRIEGPKRLQTLSGNHAPLDRDRQQMHKHLHARNPGPADLCERVLTGDLLRAVRAILMCDPGPAHQRQQAPLPLPSPHLTDR